MKSNIYIPPTILVGSTAERRSFLGLMFYLCRYFKNGISTNYIIPFPESSGYAGRYGTGSA
jgi:hypothetical protein